MKVCRNTLSKKSQIVSTLNNQIIFDEKCVEVLSSPLVSNALNERLYKLTEQDYRKIEKRLYRSVNLKKDLDLLLKKDFYHQRENRPFLYRRLKTGRSLSGQQAP